MENIIFPPSQNSVPIIEIQRSHGKDMKWQLVVITRRSVERCEVKEDDNEIIGQQNDCDGVACSSNLSCRVNYLCIVTKH